MNEKGNLPALYEATDLPAEITPEKWKEMVESDLKRSMEGVIPRLQQIKILHAGALMFKFPPDETGKEDRQNSFNGVVADAHPCRVWWKKSYQETGGGQRPDCSSLDAKTGTLFGKCSECEYSKDKSGPSGEGTACNLMKRVHIFLDGFLLPFRLSLTITSIPIYDDFVTRLCSKGFPIYSQLLHFSLDPAVSQKCIPYSKLHLSVVEQLPNKTYFTLRDIFMGLETQIRGQEIVREEYKDESGRDDLDFPPPVEDRDPDIEED